MQSANTSSREKVKSTFAVLRNLVLVGIIGVALNAGAGDSQPAPQKDPKAKKNRYSDSFFATGGGGTKEKSEKDLLLVLGGLNTIIKTEKPGGKKNDLLISRAATLLSLGKHYFLNGKTPADKEKKEAFLKKAMNSAAEAGNTPYANKNTKARSLHVYGMASLYMSDEPKAVEYFEQAIKIDPSAPISPRLSVFIAEHYFDKEQYEKALPYYSQFFAHLTPDEKALAIYKSGWCFLVLKQYDNAEKAFMKIVGKKWAGDFGTDALRDLSQTVTYHRNEQQIIQFGSENFASVGADLLVEFYTTCYLIFIRQSGNIEREVLYNEILRLEKKPEKKISLAVKKMSSHQKGYANQQVIKDILEIDSLITQSGLRPDSGTFAYFAPDLEVEIKRSISAFVDSISKKVKSPEAFSEVDLATRLQRLLWYHVTWFPKSPSIQQTYMIAMDNCTYLKDPDCSLRIGRLVLRQKGLENVWPRARVEVLIALETLTGKDPKYRPEYLQELKAYADTQLTAKEWLAFTKKLTVLYVTDKKFAEAEPFLIKIMQKEYTAENLYRKIYCQFQMQKYAEIVAHLQQIPKEGAHSNEIRTLIRESSLILARGFIEKNNFAEYEKYLFQFLNLQPDPEKADLAMADYLQKLLDRQAYDKVIASYRQMAPQKKFTGPFGKTLEQLLVILFSMNRFQEANEILSKGSIFGQIRVFDSYWLRILLALNGSLNEREIKVLATSTPAVRMGLFSIAAVTQPKLVLDYFSLVNPIDEKEKKIWLFSRQMLEGARSLFLTDREQQGLAGVVGPEVVTVGPLKSERLTKMIEFPQPNWSQERLAKITPDAMERVKSIRRQLLKDLKGQTIDVQKRVINNGILVEKRMAWFFDESPIPEGLTADELKDYKAEIDSFASEYYQQAGEYQKLLAAVISKENELLVDRIPLPSNFDKISRGRKGIVELVESEFRKSHWLRAMLVLENQRALEKVAVEEFYRWRLYLVLNQFPHELAASYLQDELAAYKQNQVMNEWKKIVGLAADVTRSTASEPKQDSKAEKK